MPEPRTARHRIFFALWPEPTLARALHDAGQQAQGNCGGRLMRRETLHMTLAFLGEVNDAGLGRAMVAGTRVASRKVSPARTVMRLDRLGFWAHNHLLWAGCSTPPPAVTELVQSLVDELDEQGFTFDKRPFFAHVTLLRQARCASESPLLPLPEWPLRELVLAASEHSAEGSGYRILRRWPLG